MNEPVYLSRVRIEPTGGPMRRAFLPGRDEPVMFGVHAEIADHYGVDPADWPPTTTTIDYLVAAAAG
jgi:hypothetical protein